jgi:hypothetical protein
MPRKGLPDIMVDLETTGVNICGGRVGVIQLGAREFDHITGEIGDCFEVSMLPSNEDHWEQGCVEFWRKQGASKLEGILENARADTRQVWLDFAKWVTHPKPYRFWSKPSHFDYVLVSGQFERHNIMNPFNYTTVINLRDKIEGLRPEPTHEVFNMYSLGVVNENSHTALADCDYQIETYFAARKALK